MDNNFNNFVNQDFKGLSNWINTLNPYEFALIGTIAAFIIAPTLNANQQNSIGNFLEEIGQILLTISSQTITVEQSKRGNTTNYGIYDEFNNSNLNINHLINEIEKIKNELYKR